MLELIDGQMAGGGVEKGVRIRDLLSLHDRMNPGMRILHNILRFSFAPDQPGHIAPEGSEGGAEEVGMARGGPGRGGQVGWRAVGQFGGGRTQGCGAISLTTQAGLFPPPAIPQYQTPVLQDVQASRHPATSSFSANSDR